MTCQPSRSQMPRHTCQVCGRSKFTNQFRFEGICRRDSKVKVCNQCAKEFTRAVLNGLRWAPTEEALAQEKEGAP